MKANTFIFMRDVVASPNTEGRRPKSKCLVALAGTALLGVVCGCGKPADANPEKPAQPVAVQTVVPHRGEIAISSQPSAFRRREYRGN